MNRIDKFANGFVHRTMKKKNVVDTDSIYNLRKNNFNRLPVPGCICSNGKTQKLFLWDGNENDLMISFNGGGVTMKPEDCAYPMSFKGLVTNRMMLYAPDAEEIFEFSVFALPKDRGIYSHLQTNPFADWTKVIIPYVSGDFHVGDADRTYTDAEGNEKVMHMRGYSNAQTILKMIKERWPNPDRILITGSSAGSFGAAAHAKQIIDLYPDCQNITLYCDSSYIPMKNWTEIMRDYWHAPEALIAPLHTDDLCGDWLEDLEKERGSRVKILYSCSTEDSVLATVSNYENTGEYKTSVEWRQKIKDGYNARIDRFAKEGIHVNWYVFSLKDPVNGGTLHTISQDKRWYASATDGISAASWVMDGVEGKLYDAGLTLLK